MRRLLPHAALLLAASLAAGCGEGSGGAGSAGVLLLSLDSVRWDHTGPVGYRPPRHPDVSTTPAMDRLGANGVAFTQAVSTTSWTLPSHMALMTGLADELHGVIDNDRTLDPGLETLAELLSKNGYATAGFFSGPYLSPQFGFGQGFDLYRNAGLDVPGDVFEGSELGRWKEVHQYSHETITSEPLFNAASEWIRGRVAKGEPFFAFVHWWDPHYDYKAPPEYNAMFDTGYQGTWTGVRMNDIAKYDPNWSVDVDDVEYTLALYDAEIRYTDDHIGRLLDVLEELDVLDDTLVVVTSDHGEEFFENPENPRWGHQRTLRDDVLRVPLVISFPGRLPDGVVANGQARLQDVYPTIADLLDLPVVPYLEGRSLRPLWEDPNHVGFPQPLFLTVPHRQIHLSGIRYPDMKVLWDHAADEGAFWSLGRDPLERTKRPFDRGELEASTHRGIAGLREWLAEAESRRAELPLTPGHGRIVIDDAMREELERLGYMGDEDDPDPESGE